MSNIEQRDIRWKNMVEMFDGIVVKHDSDDARQARLRHISKEMQICRHQIALLEIEEKHLFEELTRTAPKPTVVKPSVVSTEMLPCHLCDKKTRNKVNGLFECREHSVVSRMSELQRRVLNDFMQNE